MAKYKDIKIWIGNNPELCKQVQLKLFEDGCFWYNNGKNVQCTHANALYVDYVGCLGYTLKDRKDYFLNDKRKEVTPEEILGKKFKPTKQPPIIKHIVLQDDCDNYIGKYNSYKEAIAVVPGEGKTHTIYKLIPVAKVEKSVKVTQIK